MTFPSFRSARSRINLLAIGLIGPMALLCALSFAQQTRPSGKQETAGKAFKNIKVLKKLPAKELIPLMHKIDADLGVECGFCHVTDKGHEGFALDTKPAKEKAREMILMTERLDAHEKTVEHKVTCFTCHHGHAEPENEAPNGNNR